MSAHNGKNFTEEDLTDSQWRVYNAMCFFDQGDGCYAGRKKISELAEVHHNTVANAQFMLLKVGLIRRGDYFIGSFKKKTIRWLTKNSKQLNCSET